MDDILRKLCNIRDDRRSGGGMGYGYQLSSDDLQDAIEEIERLRAAVTQCHAITEQ